MATPVCTHIRELLETMRNAMVDFLLVRIRLCVGLADTFGNNAGIAFRVTSVFAILTLHPRRVFEKVSAKSAAHDVVELLGHELVAVHFMNLLFALTNSTFSVEPSIERSTVLCLFRKADC